MTGFVRMIITVSVAMPLTLATAPVRASDSRSERDDSTEVLRRFLAVGTPVVDAYEARRTLEATAQDGRMRATLEATTRLAGGRFSYEVVSATGSAVLRRYVLERALDEEQRTINDGRSSEAEFSSDNYYFTAAVMDAQGLARIGIRPREPAAMLLNGTLRVQSDGSLVAVEGALSQLPSYWTLHVNVERVYGVVAGERVPVVMRSQARVRLVGTGTFEMRYVYRQINGRRVEMDTSPDGGTRGALVPRI